MCLLATYWSTKNTKNVTWLIKNQMVPFGFREEWSWCRSGGISFEGRKEYRFLWVLHGTHERDLPSTTVIDPQISPAGALERLRQSERTDVGLWALHEVSTQYLGHRIVALGCTSDQVATGPYVSYASFTADSA